jgi:hypothetical protein
MKLDPVLGEIDVETLRRRENANPEPQSPREFECEECGARCTLTTDGREAGHRWTCSRRIERRNADEEGSA